MSLFRTRHSEETTDTTADCKAIQVHFPVFICIELIPLILKAKKEGGAGSVGEEVLDSLIMREQGYP